MENNTDLDEVYEEVYGIVTDAYKQNDIKILNKCIPQLSTILDQIINNQNMESHYDNISDLYYVLKIFNSFKQKELNDYDCETAKYLSCNIKFLKSCDKLLINGEIEKIDKATLLCTFSSSLFTLHDNLDDIFTILLNTQDRLEIIIKMFLSLKPEQSIIFKEKWFANVFYRIMKEINDKNWQDFKINELFTDLFIIVCKHHDVKSGCYGFETVYNNLQNFTASPEISNLVSFYESNFDSDCIISAEQSQITSFLYELVKLKESEESIGKDVIIESDIFGLTKLYASLSNNHEEDKDEETTKFCTLDQVLHNIFNNESTLAIMYLNDMEKLGNFKILDIDTEQLSQSLRQQFELVLLQISTINDIFSCIVCNTDNIEEYKDTIVSSGVLETTFKIIETLDSINQSMIKLKIVPKSDSDDVTKFEKDGKSLHPLTGMLTKCIRLVSNLTHDCKPAIELIENHMPYIGLILKHTKLDFINIGMREHCLLFTKQIIDQSEKIRQYLGSLELIGIDDDSKEILQKAGLDQSYFLDKNKVEVVKSPFIE